MTKLTAYVKYKVCSLKTTNANVFKAGKTYPYMSKLSLKDWVMDNLLYFSVCTKCSTRSTY